MKTKKRLLVSALCVLAVLCFVVGLSSCIRRECSHQWDEWKTTAKATCTDEGTQTRVCVLCGESETSAIAALGHNWKDATCTTPKTCTLCLATEGASLGHRDENRDHKCDRSCGKVDIGEHTDSATDKDHICDYGCGAALENCSDAENDGDHKCDVCGKDDVSAHNYGDATCGTPATCPECGATTGENAPHIYNQDVVKDAALKSAATCTSAAVYYKSCSCGAIATGDGYTFTFGTALPHTHDQEAVKDAALKSAATCTSAAVYYKSCVCGAVSTSDVETFTSGTPAAHSYDQNVVSNATLKSAATCTSAAVYYKSCVCGTVSTSDAETFTSGTALPHSYRLVSTAPATCEEPEKNTYECSCGDTYTEDNGDKLEHNISGVTPEERALGDCQYVLVYTCQRKGCGEEVLGETIYNHNYIASITTAATCKEDGVKTLRCACGDTITESIAKNSTGHDWVKGEESNGKRTDTCSHCGETKSVIICDRNSSGATDVSDLKNTEIELKDANIRLDDGVVDALDGKTVVVTANAYDTGLLKKLGLSAEQIEQVGNNAVYDFSLIDVTQGKEPVSQFGDDNWVTITLPYTLEEGENVDSIAVWFVNNNGELESIEATYNNGYVTFKTNHFSYYTVTRLTPAERCDLYGHEFTDPTHVDGGCTKDSYDLSVCIRCHETQIVITNEADGHNYVAETHAATCTENGYVLHTCSDCGHNYKIKQNATGHNWVQTNVVIATCQQNGSVSYGCDRCGDVYVAISPKLEHAYTHTVVAPTCEAGGYTLHTCGNCNYSYNDTFVAALGHNYGEGVWVWTADNSAATLTFTCGNDAGHVLTLEASVSTTVTNGTCSSFVRTTYIAAVSYNGAVYTDEKSVEEGTPNHVFSTDWKTDGNKHWHECICGQRTDVAEHSYANDTVTKAPTCTVDGESTAYCTCGKTHTTVVPATGEHTYVDGFCSSCGKEEINCDHTELHREFIDFGALGACNFVFYYETCLCGEVKTFNPEGVDIPCRVEEFVEEEYEDENGNVIEKYVGICVDCGLEVYGTAYYTEDGCYEVMEINYSFKLNGAVVIDNLSFTYTDEYHRNKVRVEADLSEYGACGGTVALYKCADCGEVEYIGNLNADCGVDFNADPVEEKYTDEEGIEHTVEKIVCPDCGLTVKTDTWVDVYSVCESVKYAKTTVLCGDNIIYDYTDSEERYDHKLEYTYELMGESCIDGVKTTIHCSVCGETYIYFENYHVEREYDFNIDLSEHSSCGGFISVDRCKACGEILSVYGSDINCDMSDYTTEEILDADGNVIGEKNISTCPDCGLSFVESQWIEYSSVCEYTEYFSSYIYKGGECIVKYENKYGPYRDHETEMTYEDNRTDCSEDYTVIITCKKCDYKNTWQSSGHRYVDEEVDLTQHGGCGKIFCEYCETCGIITDIYRLWDCSLGREIYEEYEDENGKQHSVSTQTCSECGLVYTIEYVYEMVDSCTYNVTCTESIQINGNTVIESIRSETRTEHDNEREYLMLGDSCEDGYRVFEYCTECGHYSSWTGTGHENLYFETDLSDVCCGGYMMGYKCGACGIIREMYDFRVDCEFGEADIKEVVDENGITHNITTDICTKCGLKRISEYWSIIESECVTVFYSKAQIYTGDGECIVDYENIYRDEAHEYDTTYEMLGDDCYDGVLITETCTVCGNIETHTNYGHSFKDNYIDLEELGLCGGEIHESSCVYCGYVRDSYFNEYCEWEYAGEANDGVERYVCSKCGVYKFRYYSESEKDENCNYDATETIIYVLNRVELYRFERTDTYSDHDYSDEFIMSGDSCEDGYTVISTCNDCGVSYENRYSYHNVYIDFMLSDVYDGCESHNIYAEKCPCGEEYYFRFDSYNFVYDSATQTYTCNDCGVSVSVVDVKEENGCFVTETTQYTVSVYGEELYSGMSYDSYIDHCFSKTETTSADGVISVALTCDKCGEKTINQIYSIELVDGAYEFNYTPDVSGSFSITSPINRKNYPRGLYFEITVYNTDSGDLVYESFVEYYNNDGSFYLEEGVTYRFDIIGWDYAGETVDGTALINLKYSEEDDVYCSHRGAGSSTAALYNILLEGGVSCTDGVIYGYCCNYCGLAVSNYTANSHGNILMDSINLEENGACYGYVNFYSCLCGENSRVDMYTCGYYTENHDYDDNGNYVTYITHRCDECGLRIDHHYYTVEDKANCKATEYHSLTVTMGSTLVCNKEYTVNKAAHDYEVTTTLLGTSCEDGVETLYKCKTCEHEQTNTYYYHEWLELERIDIAEHGSVCGGYAVLEGCACGQYVQMNTNNCLCDFEYRGSSSYAWITDTITGFQYNVDDIYGSNYLESWGYKRICSVTDPERCAYVIRWSRYWLKAEDECRVYEYQTWQFGYNEETGEFEREVTFKTGESRMYHDYNDESENGNTKHVCKDCGSEYVRNYVYDAEERLIKQETRFINTLTVGNYKYYETVNEWSYDENGETTEYREYEKYISIDGEEYWYENKTKYESYEAPFGENGRKDTVEFNNSYGENSITEEAYTFYKDYQYTIYRYMQQENGYWERYEYEYSFADGCKEYYTYSDSYGNSDSEERDICKMHRYETITYPTCTQDGEECQICVICDKHSEPYTTSPNGHSWKKVSEAFYYCSKCGLANANGASGDIYMEDMTEQYGNGESYVVGYYTYSYVDFYYCVSLILPDRTEVILDDVDIYTVEGIRAFVFNKAEVDALAEALGYTEYDVRFTFYPVGGDGSFDYGLTFTDDDMQDKTISGKVEIVEYLDSYETKTYTITPKDDGEWMFDVTSNTSYVELEIFDNDGNRIYDSWGWNYTAYAKLTAGEMYTVKISWYYESDSGLVAYRFQPCEK